MLSRDAILGFQDDRIEPVEIAGLGGTICVGRLTVEEMDVIANAGAQEKKTPMSVIVAIAGACGEDGKRLFTTKDRDALMKLPVDAMAELMQAILAHNGLKAGQAEEPKND